MNTRLNNHKERMRIPLQEKPFTYHQFFYGSIVLWLFCVSCSQEQQKKSAFDQLHGKEVIHITISTDIDKLLDSKEEERQQAVVHWPLSSEARTIDTIDVKTRGKTRKAICDFPPLKLYLPKTLRQAKDLANYRSLKLVTHCQGDEELVLKEFLSYRLLNELTPNSYRVQLAKVKYVDSKGKHETEERFAFLLENNKEMADRIGGSLLPKQGKKLNSLNSEQYQLLTLFQFMIGNTDWNLSKQHNIKLVKPAAGQAAIPVPYDFDYAGLVDAPYAIPHPQLPIADVKERFFQWRGKQSNDFASTIQLFLAKKQNLIDLCYEFEWLNEKAKDDMVGYLQSFYEIVEVESHLKDQVLANLKAQYGYS